MSEPTYRIDVVRRGEGHAENRYRASVKRMSDGFFMFSGYGPKATDALEAACQMIAEQGNEPPIVAYADEAGELVQTPEPQSLRA